jgi:hypothetical protein
MTGTLMAEVTVLRSTDLNHFTTHKRVELVFEFSREITIVAEMDANMIGKPRRPGTFFRKLLLFNGKCHSVDLTTKPRSLSNGKG